MFRKFNQSRLLITASSGALLFLVLVGLVFWGLNGEETENLPQPGALSKENPVQLSTLTEKQNKLLGQYISKDITLNSPTRIMTTLYEVKGGQTLAAILIKAGVVGKGTPDESSSVKKMKSSNKKKEKRCMFCTRVKKIFVYFDQLILAPLFIKNFDPNLHADKLRELEEELDENYEYGEEEGEP